MVDVTSQTTIRVPVHAVYDYVADQSNAPEWYDNIKSVELDTGPGVTVGSRFTFVASFLGRRLTYTYEVTELIEHQRLVMRTADGPFEMETSYEWRKAAESQTEMILRNRGNPTGFSRVAAPFMERAMRRANEKDLAKLKSLLEERASARLGGG